MSGKPRVAILIQPYWRPAMLNPASEAELADIAEVVDQGERTIVAEDMPALLDGAVACLTGWETPPLTDALLDASPALRLIAHTAGTVRRMVPRSAFVRGIRVSQSTPFMADAVAEHIVAQALLSLQGLHRDDARMREGGWWTPGRWTLNRRLLAARTVGIWGMGRAGVAASRLFSAFGCTVLGTDPTLSPFRARELGVKAVSLPELFEQSEVLVLLAPLLDATRGAVDAAMLARLRDGAILINSGRGALVDEAALLAELGSGRIAAALDVHHVEPLPADSPFRALPNVLLSPHVGGHTVDTQHSQGQAMVDEVRRLLEGEPLWYEVTAESEGLLA